MLLSNAFVLKIIIHFNGLLELEEVSGYLIIEVFQIILIIFYLDCVKIIFFNNFILEIHTQWYCKAASLDEKNIY